MSALSNAMKNYNNRQNAEIMYSVEGASFQEYCISILDAKGSKAHQAIGKLVTDINNNRISVIDAKAQFVTLLNN